MRRWFSITSRYSPVNHICITPPGVSISMHTRRLPPARTSIFATGTVAPSGPYHALKCSGSVHICQMRSGGASKLRSITTASRETLPSAIVLARLSLRSELHEVAVHLVEAGLPDGPVLLGPGRDLLQTCGVESAWPVLGSLALYDQSRPLQHLDVLGDGRKRQVERLGELVDIRFPLGEPGQDRPACRAGQRGEGLAKPILVGHERHGPASYFPDRLIN